MAIDNIIHKIGFARKRFAIYGASITIDDTTETIDGTLDTIDKTHEITII